MAEPARHLSFERIPMGDSFFGFNTNMPPLSDGELRQLENDDDKAGNKSDDPDVYDFEALKNELGGDEDDDVDDGLGDMLIEEGDGYNDETFGDSTVGQDFDFFESTKKFTSRITDEEGLLPKRQSSIEQLPKPDFRGDPWATSDHSPGSLSARASPADLHGSTVRSLGTGPKFGESSPVGATSSSSIWGGFSGSLSSERGFGSFTASAGSLSPFARRQKSQQLQQQQSPIFTPSPPPGLSPSSSFGQRQRPAQPVSLEDIEAELHRRSGTGGFRQDVPQFPAEEPEGRRMLSLSEVEAAMVMGERQRALQQKQQQFLQSQALHAFGFGAPDPTTMLSIQQQQQQRQREAEKASLEQSIKQREYEQRKARYDGLMTQNDKDFINRIQLQQLASSDPYSDDFYYQVYTSIRQRAGLPTWSASMDTQNKGSRGRKEENAMQRFHQQLQRVVNNAKKHPRQTQVSLEGALGKITSLTVRNPRQVLQVSEKKPSASTASHDGTKGEQKGSAMTGKSTVPGVNDKRVILRILENMYLTVLHLEQMRRQLALQPKHANEEEHEVEMKSWNEEFKENVNKLWESLRLLEPTDGSPPFIISMLSVSKGKKLIPRIVRHLSGDQILTMLSVIIANFSQLHVCHNVVYPGSMVANAEEAKKQKFVKFEEVELFINTAAPPLLGFISEAPLQVVNGLMRLFMEKNDITEIARSKPGLAFLTMLLSRAEILKQGGGALHGLAPPSPNDLAQWQMEYTQLFNSLQGRYASIFPSLYYLVPLQPNMNIMQLSLSVDDMYVWQFLAAMAVGATMEQQHILVTEVRDRVMENIVLANSNHIPPAQSSQRISNINLFLHALGLDSSQVTIPR